MRKRFKVKLELFRKSVSELLTFGSSVVSHINTNSFFVTPHPDLADITTALTELQTASDNANGGGLEEHSIMNDKRQIVEDLLTECGHYVEDIANDATNVDQETTVIDSAGMRVKGFTPRQKRVFSGIAGKLSGEVNLFATGVRRGFHEWSYNPTPDNPNGWVELTSTTKGVKLVTGLTRLTDYAFRHRAILITGPEPWEDPITVSVV